MPKTNSLQWYRNSSVRESLSVLICKHTDNIFHLTPKPDILLMCVIRFDATSENWGAVQTGFWTKSWQNLLYIYEYWKYVEHFVITSSKVIKQKQSMARREQ